MTHQLNLILGQQLSPQTLILIAGGIFLLVIGLILAMAFITYGKLWFQAYMSSADVSMFSLIGMGFRKVRPSVIVQGKIMASQAGLNIGRKEGISTQRMEAHYLAGGNLMRVINAIIAAQRAGIDLDYDCLLYTSPSPRDRG